jgi:hypothetical protein
MGTSPDDIVDALLTQHRQIKQFFAETLRASGQSRRELFRDLVALLAVHESVEQILVHPLAEQRLPDGGSVVAAEVHEEQDAKMVLARLYQLDVDAPAFADGLSVLREALMAHAQAEEEYEFPSLRQVVSPEHLRRLVFTMKAVQAMAPAWPPAANPPSPSTTILAGPPLAVFDRARDVLRDTKAI